jgi:Lrp/AsnC family transcriptional regulator for asnA, asnC and gidA
MTIAIVLLNTDLGEGPPVDNSLRDIDEVKEVWPVYGVFDYLVKVETEDMSALKEIIYSKIRQIENVRSTLTLINTE